MTDSEYSSARSMAVRTKQGELGQFGGVITVHNDEQPCSNAPTKADYTDLVTAAVGVDVKLCQHCAWPEQAEQVLRDEGSLYDNLTEEETQ